MSQSERKTFWAEVVAIRGSVTPRVLPRVLAFGLFALAIWAAHELTHELDLHLAVAPYEVAGAVLGLLLVLRTNAGYERWWEARRIWGGIVNQSRNLAISGLTYGPDDPRWRTRFIRWAAVFPHIARRSLRGERDLPEVAVLVGEDEAARIAAARHMPDFVATMLARLLREAVADGGMDRFAFLQVDRERATLIDHIGACERILKTPLPRVHGIMIRQFVCFFLLILPFALLDKVGAMTAPLTMLIACPILALDQIGVDLQNPFSTRRLSHLPLDEISHAIEADLDELLRMTQTPSQPPDLRVIAS